MLRWPLVASRGDECNFAKEGGFGTKGDFAEDGVIDKEGDAR